MAINRMMHWCALSVVLLLFTATASAGPRIESWHTSQGAKVLFVAAPDLPMVDVRVVFDGGSARDDALPGIAVLTNATMTDGAGEWNADQLAERLESVGAELDSGARKDMAWVSMRSLTDSQPFNVAMESLAAILAKPRFDTADLERNRQAMLVSLRQGEQNPGSIAKKTFWRKVFDDHPYAEHSGGTKASLAKISAGDVAEFYKRYYVARNAVVSIVGALDRGEAEALAERITRQLPAGEHAPKVRKVTRLSEGLDERSNFPSSQSHILMGQPGMHRGDPDYFVLYVGNHIFGGSGLVSLLSDEVREKRGLSYSVYSYFSPMREDGPFIMGAQTQNARVAETVEVMRKTLAEYIRRGPTDDELLAAKQNITGGFPLRIASNGKIVEYLSMIGFYDLPLTYLDDFVGKIEAVTGEQIKEAFQRRVDPDRFVTVVVGNGEEK